MLPIDAFIDEPLHHMSPSPGIELHPAGAEVHSAAKAAVAKHCAIKFAPLERFALSLRPAAGQIVIRLKSK